VPDQRVADLNGLFGVIKACRICENDLPLGPRPVVRGSVSSSILIIGQAPGTKVHETGIPWNDPSGDRLRNWLGVDRDAFYDERNFAIMPMGFCYPGRNPKGGDNPPRRECAPAWHDQMKALLSGVELILLVGSYAQKYYLGKSNKKTMTETVRHWRDYGPGIIPTPHPSWRTTAWLKRNPWFEMDVVPELRRRTNALYAAGKMDKLVLSID
jgi:uracil-DNA glycosylase family 4